jgi:histidinol-phosphate aminotransferase
MKFNKHLDNINSYEAGKPIELVVREFGIDPKKVIKMASNENPFGMSKRVSDAISQNAYKGYLYPDDSMFELKKGLAKRFDLNEDEIIIGAGSDQVLEFISRAKLSENSKVLMNKITFAMYSIYSKQVGAEIFTTDSTHHDLNQFLDIYKKENPEVIFICTPNNPTGEAIERDRLYSFLDNIDHETLVVVDGAYMEYAQRKDDNFKIEPKEIIEKYPNVIYLGTFSKAFGLGGMRVGYGIAKSSIISSLYKVRPPFNITTLSLLSAIEALKDLDFVENSISVNFSEMKRFEDFAKDLGFEFITSATNFITILLPERYNSSNISDYLLRVGIIVRNLKGYGLNAVRITIGKPEENSRFFEVFKDIL